MKSGSLHLSMQAVSTLSADSIDPRGSRVAASQGWVQAQNAFFQAHRINTEVQERVQESMKRISQAREI